ncbi:MAG: amidase [Desulfobacteraceae bacterium]|jgi:Asp-tRNA(Asn)/Glu-tRNA(Gln) amidotransferase A subunit family amidase
MSLHAEYENYDAMGLAELVQTGQITPTELLEDAIERIETINPKVNAVIASMYDDAHRQIQRGLPDGPLKGVPFLLKDLGLFYAGLPTTFGSRFFADYIPDQDSEIVTRYRNAGLVFVGKTNVPEFGITITTESQLFGPCRNPWNLDRTSGGSSGGAAVAVATGMVPAAHGSDGGGSIRIPASCCGLFGLKPTRGRIPSGPHTGEAWNGMVTHHTITRTVRDSALLLDISAGPAPGDPYWAPFQKGSYLEEVGQAPGKLRIAITTEPPGGVKVDSQCIAAVEQAALLCQDLGHHIITDKPRVDSDLLQFATVTIINTNLRAMLEMRGRMLGREVQETDVEPITWLASEAGRETSAADFARAIEGLHQLGRSLAAFFENVDLLLSPVLLQPPVPLGYLDTTEKKARNYLEKLYSFFGFTALFNATGQPAMSVPLYWTPDQLPIGVQFAGRFGEEDLLLRLAGQLEEARPWKNNRPSI